MSAVINKNKREDIQWLRAFAIISVILFHIWPNSFPYGYLGVDIFFVISGYLMTLILLKPGSKLSIADFYFRRIKRIFPTCLFIIFLTLFIGYFFLLWSFFRYYGMLYSFWSIPVIFTIITLGILIHEMFEKPLTRYSWIVNGTILAIMYTVIISLKLVSNPYPEPDISLPLNINSSTYNPIIANEMEAISCEHLHYPCDEGIFDTIPRNGKYKPFCAYNLTSTSNKTAVIFGNSYAYMQSKGILTAIKEAKTKFKKVYLLIAFSCNPVTGNLYTVIDPRCKTADDIFSSFLSSLKPDIIVFSASFGHIKQLNQTAPAPEETIKHPIYPQLLNLLRYANYTNKFIIIEPNPGLTEAGTYKTPLSISEALIAGKDLNKFKKSIKSYERMIYNAWKWIKPVINECKNCKVVKTRDIFCNKKECDFIDRKSMLGLYCDEGHISPRTSFKYIPQIISAIDI